MMLFHIVAGIFGSFGFHLENQPQEKPGATILQSHRIIYQKL
jgi:hypothetical protein